MSNASLQITSWSWEKIETQKQSYTAESMAATKYQEKVMETVRARFEIVGGQSFRRRDTNGGPEIQPNGLEITFKSVNGDAWRVEYGARLTGTNIKKDGTLGAEVELSSYSFPEWVLALYERDGQGRSDALDWVRAEYSR